MNIVIIEDERLTAQRLLSLLKKYDAQIHVLAELTSVESAVNWFIENETTSIDLIFMDVHLEDGDSFQIIKQVNLLTPIIFTTAFDEYMVKAFKVNSIDYLLKPVNYDELVNAIEKYKSLKLILSEKQNDFKPEVPNLDQLLASLGKATTDSYKDRFMVTVGTKIRIVKTTDIAYFFLEEKVVLLATFENNILPIDYSLDKLVQSLDPKHFFRISRQFIVSLNSIQLVHAVAAGKLKLDLNPKPKQEVYVSGDRITDFKGWLGK